MTMNPTLTPADRLMNGVMIACHNCGMKHLLHKSEWDGNEFYCTDFPACIAAKEKSMADNETNFSVGYEGDPNEIMAGAGTDANPIGNPEAKPGETTPDLPVGEYATPDSPNANASPDAEEEQELTIPEEQVPADAHDENPGIEYEEAKIHSANNEQE